ncbi:hypothetical protein AB6A40_009732 [Gnathostoma spinigerum]|uniref:Ig-like domain-containing protein n=1 Tax=Gnathostoma spinigerum TaxID=75299 RepID=A0ABD6F0G9_9BILA
MKILLIFLLCLLATPSTAKCPLVCNCDEKEVNCRGRSLEKIPRNLPPKIHHLDLRDNDIQAILRSDLKGYDHLETLLISNNQIEYIDENFLDMLPSLKKLSISRNVIRYIPMLCSQTSHLIHADFHMNQISKIHNLAFSQLIYLRTINLENNLIQSLPQSLPFHTSHIHTIHLLGNPINCDCRWRPFIESSRLQTDKMSLCLNPPELRDVPIVTLKSSDVECLTPTVMSGRHSLILSCRPNAKSTFWFYRDTPLSDSLRPDFVYLPNNSISIPKSFNPNLIKCAIDHSISIKRRTRHLKESTPPSFTLRPSSRSHREGSRVRLDCEVVGSPRPKIQWYFNGRKLKPSRKYEMNFEKTTLNVDPFLERDVGK